MSFENSPMAVDPCGFGCGTRWARMAPVLMANVRYVAVVPSSAAFEAVQRLDAVGEVIMLAPDVPSRPHAAH